MINFNLNLSNPFSNRWDIIWATSKMLSKHKAIEFNGYKTHSILELDFSLTFRQDHSGLRVMLGLIGYNVELHYYDTRHWDYDNNIWE